MKLDVLAISVHPDDAELSCSGTLLAAKAAGKKTGILDLTRGELGTRGSAELRDQEAAASSKILGLGGRENRRMRDGFVFNTEEYQLQIIAAIRKYRPEIILANAIRDRHPDHGNAATLTREANFKAGLAKIETVDENGEPQERWRAKLYHYIQDYYIDPDFVVDISDHMEKKMEAIKAFSSQFYNPNAKTNEPETYISSSNFLESIRSRAVELGRTCGFKYAEGFTASRIHGVKQISDIY